MIDGQIEDGKFKRFFVYSKDIPMPPLPKKETYQVANSLIGAAGE